MNDIDNQARATREKYGDIIDLPRPATSRARMSMENRAAQFAPFAALTGYHESVEDTEARVSSDNESGGVASEAFYD